VKAHPVFARIWDPLVRLGGRQEQEHRAELVRGLRGRVLELGAGTCLNFERYRRGVQVVAVEPVSTMTARAAGRARRAAAAVRVLRAVAEDLPFPVDSFDALVACYVLCSVGDQRRAIEEIRRVLRPGGEVRVYEHVRSSHPRWARVQDAVTPAWRRFGCNCHPNRDTTAALESAGFRVEVRAFSIGLPAPVRPHVLGVARLR
jgi:ubiquinone/menaquinone biosynthesis C-methylase UbiE